MIYHYDQAIADIQNGDLFLFRGTRCFARLIQLVTRSVYSHVGIAAWTHINGVARLCVLEAMEGKGVRLQPMDVVIQECLRQGVVVDWYALEDRWLDRKRVVSAALAVWGKRYASPWQFLVSWGRLTRLLLRFLGNEADRDTNGERFFCSELVAQAFQEGGYVHDEPDIPIPARTDPGAIARYSCLQRRGTLVL